MGKQLSKTPLVISESNVNLTVTTFLSNNMAGSLHNVFHLGRITLESSTTSSDVSVGEVMTLTHSTLSIDNCLFEDNSANIGGAIFSELDSNITITS